MDIKNRESPAPFAFIQFASIESVVSAIQECQAAQRGPTGLLGAKGERLKLKVRAGEGSSTAACSGELGPAHPHRQAVAGRAAALLQPRLPVQQAAERRHAARRRAGGEHPTH